MSLEQEQFTGESIANVNETDKLPLKPAQKIQKVF